MPILDIYLREMKVKVHKKAPTQIFIFNIILTKPMKVNRRVDTLNVLFYTMEYNSAIERGESLLHRQHK